MSLGSVAHQLGNLTLSRWFPVRNVDIFKSTLVTHWYWTLVIYPVDKGLDINLQATWQLTNRVNLNSVQQPFLLFEGFFSVLIGIYQALPACKESPSPESKVEAPLSFSIILFLTLSPEWHATLGKLSVVSFYLVQRDNAQILQQ